MVLGDNWDISAASSSSSRLFLSAFRSATCANIGEAVPKRGWYIGEENSCTTKAPTHQEKGVSLFPGRCPELELELDRPDRQTDRQTDRHPDRQPFLLLLLLLPPSSLLLLLLLLLFLLLLLLLRLLSPPSSFLLPPPSSSSSSSFFVIICYF
jgi:hypothetical protein